METSSHIIAGLCVGIASWVGVVLTLLTLPGMWIALLVAVAVQAWQPGTFSWWTLGTCCVLAVIGEIVEFAASAAGAAKGGASRRGAIGAIVGSVVGAIAGSFFVPPLGTIAGAVVGAGLAVGWVELALNDRSLAEAAKAGTGAAAGRLLATVAKTAIAAVVAIILCIAAWV